MRFEPVVIRGWSRPITVPRSGVTAAAAGGGERLAGTEWHDGVLIVTGTRPEIVKMAPVFFALQFAGIPVEWNHSGQHDLLARQMFDSFGVMPSSTLTREASRGVSGLVASLLDGLEPLFESHSWDAVLVHGDTASTLAGALGAFYAGIPLIGHVEAGLRTGNRRIPFPEESNRRLVADIADRHYAPTERAAKALKREGISDAAIRVTGNTGVDAQLWLQRRHAIVTDRLDHVLVTLHRRENWPIAGELAGAVAAIARGYPHLRFVVPLHPNPQLREQVRPALEHIDNVALAEPLDYLALQRVLAQSALVITDSGGLQEEAPTLGVPCVVVRDDTERPEAIEAGLATLAGREPDDVIAAARAWLDDPIDDVEFFNPFGDGQAAARIAADLRTELNP